MAGNRFKRERNLYQLNFEGTDLDGFEVVMKGVSLERFIDITKIASALETPEGRTPENIEAQFTVLSDLLVSWNLDDDDDQPVPATYDGLKAAGLLRRAADHARLHDGHLIGPKSLERRLTLWRDFGGSITRTGEVVSRPGELAEAELLLAVCDRFKCLPSQARGEDAGILRLLKIEQLGRRKEDEQP